MLIPLLRERLEVICFNDKETVDAIQKQLWDRKGGMSTKAMRVLLLPQNSHLFTKQVGRELLHLHNQVTDSEGEGSQVDGELWTP